METKTNQRGVETGEKIDINGQNIVTGHECVKLLNLRRPLAIVSMKHIHY